ncbi:MAG: hypothetical protein JXB88_09895 [Spirochaetales bacterium]|nr:hypothetical protein [Spirochaetales bacterium]
MKYNALIIILMTLMVTGCVGTKDINRGDEPEMSDTEDINIEGLTGWEKIDALERKGLTRSILDELDVLYREARKEKKQDELIKIIIYRAKYESQITEEATVQVIRDIKDVIEETEEPAKSIIKSILADFFWQYYENNRYKFSQRTETAELEDGDITTWDIRKLVNEISGLYLSSLSEKDLLKKTKIDEYEKILIQGNSRDIRPTLYDFLAHRALDFFLNEEAYLTRPAYKFELNDERLFSPAEVFSRLKLTTEDTVSLKFQALLIFQDILAFHLSDTDPAPLIHADVKRLDFVKRHAVEMDKDTLYLKALEQSQKKYKDHAASGIVSHKIAEYYGNRASLYTPGISDEHKWDKKKALDICDSVIKAFPRSEGAVNCMQLSDRIREKALTFNIEKANSRDTPFLALITYKNLQKVSFKIIQMTEKERDKAYEIEYDTGTEGRIDYYNSFPSVASFSGQFPDDGDFQEHSTEIRIPALDYGYYIILASAKEDFSLQNNAIFYSPVWITDIGFIVSEDWETGKKSFYVTDRETGEPLKGVKARILSREWSYSKNRYVNRNREQYTTDKNGYFTVKAADSRDFVVRFVNKEDTCLFEDQYYQYKPQEYKKNPLQTIFFTDRAIYRPGQTIYFKGLVLRELDKQGDKKKIETNYRTTVYFYDVNSQVISQLDVTTNEYGTFNGTFTAPSDRLNGNMYIANDTGSRSFSVEEYKRPKFEVLFDPVKGSYKLGEKVKVKGNAKAYSGFAIDNAEVRFRVIRNAIFPYWYWYWGAYPSSEEIEIKNGMMKTDEKGEFGVEFIALPDLKLPEKTLPVFTYTVYADITDINGETHSSRVSVRVGYVALSVDTRVPDSINKDKEQTLEIKSLNLNDVFEPARGVITITALQPPSKTYRERLWKKPDIFILNKQDYYSSFPHDAYAGENEYYTWERTTTVFHADFDTGKEKKLVLNTMQDWQQGKYLLELATKDGFGREIRLEKYFTLYSGKDKQLPFPESFWYMPGNVICQPGETASIEIGTSEKDIHVIYECILKDGISEIKHLVLTNQKMKLTFPVEEKHRGNFTININLIRHNRVFIYSQPIQVNWTNKELNIEFETFRDKLLPGEKEEWRLKLTGSKGEKTGAEMVAALYDASLDAFRLNNWNMSLYPYFYSYRNWQGYISFNSLSSNYYDNGFNSYSGGYDRYYDRINFYNFSFAGRYYELERTKSVDDGIVMEEKSTMKEDFDKAPPSPAMEDSKETISGKKEETSGTLTGTTAGDDGRVTEGKAGFEEVTIRSNLNETAFFYPELLTDSNGNIIISFTIPEALTRWKMLGFAHTKDVEYGYVENELVTQKDLMIIPNPPRFFRENDTITFTAKVTNLSDKDLEGNAKLELYNAVTMEPVDSLFENNKAILPFTVKKEQSAPLEWNIAIPESIQAVTYRVIARAGNFSDGEESTLPVLTNRMMVTESLPLPVRGKETKTFTFQKLKNSGTSKTLTHYRVTLEFTSHPAWYSIQALPYIMEYPYECSEQVFSRFYANSIATHIVNSNPGIKKVFDSWRNSGSLKSNLEKNEELKSLLLQETPWVLNAQDESERKKRVALLFDLNKMKNELGKAMKKIIEMQAPNGGWPWFPGLPDDRYITQHITAGMGHLDRLGIRDVRDDNRLWTMIANAVHYMDAKMQADYEYLVKNNIKLDQNNIGYLNIHYLYTRSFFTDIQVNDPGKKAFEYWKDQAGTYWLDFNRYLQGMISIALYRFDNKKTAAGIIASLKENAIYSEELGMYWKSNTAGYYWYQAPVETQSLLIEAFDEVSGDRKAIEEMKIWLLKQKQTQDWKTTKATADACYALLLKGVDLLASDELVEITLGTMKVDPKKMEDVKVEAGTGYFKTSWAKEEITPEMGTITVVKKDEGVAWGALYWQYFEQLDKITPHETPLKLKKQIFLQVNTDRGPVIKPVTGNTALKPGDLIKVRIELTVDRDMEYLHMKDMRASGMEPTNVFSGYRYQDGLWYYESTKDASTNFFFPWITKGTYVFEYPLHVTHRGDFSNGITTIQCMYAPEFTSHSEGVRIKVQ